MPLPTNSSISLQGHSRPGEGVTTKPKLAMIVRMTEETLDALQNISPADRMDFEFGSHPGIHIRDQCFPMHFSEGGNSHELFIRTTMSARPNAPLRLNANVVGKFTVERGLSEKLSNKIQQATAAAAKEKSGRGTILLETPPIKPTVTKSTTKRKAPVKAAPRTSQPSVLMKSYAVAAPPSAANESKVTISSTSTISKEVSALLRQRLVHYLALGSAATADILKRVGGVEAELETRQKIIELLNEVAEQEQAPRKTATSGSQEATKWRLRPQTWLEVRPYQYPDYTDNVRTSVARTARTWLSSLKIPETDAAWEHVKFRSGGAGASTGASASVSAGGSGPTPRAVNGTSSAKEKEKKATKARDHEVRVKSEAVQPGAPPPVSAMVTTATASISLSTPEVARPKSLAVSSSSRNGKGKDHDPEKEEGELSASQTPPRSFNGSSLAQVRRAPGSRPTGASASTSASAASSSVQHPTVSQASHPTPSSSQSAAAASLGGAPPKRTGPVDVRGPKRTAPEPSERARAAPPIPPPTQLIEKKAVAVQQVQAQAKKERLSAAGGSSNTSGTGSTSVGRDKDRDRDRGTEPVVRERGKELDRESLRPPDKERAREVKRERERERDSDRESAWPRDKEVGRRERERESDRESVRGIKRERERESDRESVRGRDDRDRPREKDTVRDREREREKEQRERERAKELREREREKERRKDVDRDGSTRERERPRERDSEIRKDRERPPAASSSTKVGTKRKQPEYSDDDSSDWGYEERKSVKKPLATTGAGATSKTQKERERDTSLAVPSKSSTSKLKARRESSPPRKIKRELSPLPPSKSLPTVSAKPATGSSTSAPRQVSSQSVKREAKVERESEREDRGRERERFREGSSRSSNGGSTKRRRSPIYTSTDEDEKPLKTKAAAAPAVRMKTVKVRASPAVAARPVSSATSHPASATPNTSNTSRSRPSHPLPQRPTHAPLPIHTPHLPQPLPPPSDHEGLRSRYSSTYVAYIGAFQRLYAQKAQISRMLRHQDRASSVGSAESDGDIDMLSIEELEHLSAEHKRLHEELESIKKAYLQ